MLVLFQSTEVTLWLSMSSVLREQCKVYLCIGESESPYFRSYALAILNISNMSLLFDMYCHSPLGILKVILTDFIVYSFPSISKTCS